MLSEDPVAGFSLRAATCMIAKVIVMKFGGSSVGDAQNIQQVVQIVRQHLPRGPVVVVSAHAGITDALLAVAESAAGGGGDCAAIADRHRTILRDLGLPGDLLDPLLAELQDLARGLRLVGGASAKATDVLLSFGERCSARTVAAALRQGGVPATAVDAFAAGLRTDSSFGRARPMADDGRIARALSAVVGVPVVTGFVAGDELGNVTTLGRNGSDYSAALFGAALGVEEIQIWKDVDGVRTADPKLVPGARPIRHMSFEEICEMASFGSKVLHPAAMLPAMQRAIPVLVRNTGQPDQPGTRIELAGAASRPGVSAIAHRAKMAMMTVTADRLVPQHLILSRLFAELHAAGLDVGPVSVSAASVTFAMDQDAGAAIAPRLRDLGDLHIERDQAVVGIVGDAATIANGAAAAALSALSASGIAVRCAAQGARGGTFAVIVSGDRLASAVAVLHDRFFAEGVA